MMLQQTKPSAINLLNNAQAIQVKPVAVLIDNAKKHFGPNDLGVMIFGDSGRAYLTKNFY